MLSTSWSAKKKVNGEGHTVRVRHSSSKHSHKWRMQDTEKEARIHSLQSARMGLVRRKESS